MTRTVQQSNFKANKSEIEVIFQEDSCFSKEAKWIVIFDNMGGEPPFKEDARLQIDFTLRT